MDKLTDDNCMWEIVKIAKDISCYYLTLLMTIFGIFKYKQN